VSLPGMEGETMGELVKYIAQNLVDKPEEVKVILKEGDHSTIIELSVAPDDMGKVIGKQGRIAKAIRTVVKAASVRDNKKYIVEIV
jgi:predicted RNA-binding protein YlqC (UPF0109 family)